MQKISLPAAAKITSPNPVSIVCTLREDGETNLATVSWWTYLSYSPSMIAYAMAKSSEALTSAVLGCGSTTGRKTDKVARFGIEMQSLPDCPIRVPAHSCAAIVCDLKEFHEVGDHYLSL